ncbi:hypothetical protein N0V93_005091 [Gnomoniopsis smithogilvyi]|uniref:C2H2-type domain-containing protein n=1 Tax=Gnomoniopsis smithogilvyi TaxID=1191159 RepID=A0A9W9CXR4_9PEZI|nr:hypothetical protein N0V93_005091 [Gnomoniopsis smithogilvyi]
MGTVYHATDVGRRAMDLYRQSFTSSSGMLQSRTVVVALYVGQMDPKMGKQHLDYASRDDLTHLMDKRYLPSNEPIWTCRIWAKTVLSIAHQNRYIQLPADLNRIDLSAMATADVNLPTQGMARTINTYAWLNNVTRVLIGGRSSGTVPMDIDSSGGQYLGPKPMQGVVFHCRRCRRQFDGKDEISRHYQHHPSHR